MLKALSSSFEFYADGFVEYVSKALSSSFEFYADGFVEFGLRDLIWKLVHWLMSQLGCVIQVLGFCGSSWDFLGSKKKPKHRHRRQAKKKVQKWRRHALPYGLVMKCLRQPRNMPQRLVGPEKPVCWRWKKRNFGLAEVQSRI